MTADTTSSIYSVESQWRGETERRHRIIKLMLIVCLVFLFTLVVIWFWVTQPLWSASGSDGIHLIDPARLERHVRKLSLDLNPRDESRPDKLDLVAAYIREEFERTEAVITDQPYIVNNKTYRNVIAEFGPDVNERVIVGERITTPQDRFLERTITQVELSA